MFRFDNLLSSISFRLEGVVKFTTHQFSPHSLMEWNIVHDIRKVMNSKTDQLIIIWVNTLWALNLLLAGQGLGSFLMAEDGMSLANRGTMNLDDENNVLTIEVSQLFFKDIITNNFSVNLSRPFSRIIFIG